MYQPIAFVDFNVPGIVIAFPSGPNIILPVNGSPSRFTRPASLTSNAIAFARRVEVVLRLILNATKNSRAPITVAPRFASYSFGPKSGFHSGNFIFLKNPSYSPARMIERLLRSLLG